MNNKIKNITLVIVFSLFIFGILLINLIIEDTLISKSERRKLAQFPELSLESIFNNKNSFMTSFETYSLDQFVGRDFFRRIKAFTVFNILRQNDNNKIYIAEGHASKYMDTFKDTEVLSGVKKFNKLYDEFLSNMNVYYSIIPDKNYFIAEQNGYPSINYDNFVQIFKENINSNIQYIDIFNTLTINDYYTTDIHWRQEKINNVVEKLATTMNFEYQNNYTLNELNNFYGVYYGQSALPLDSETLYYCTSDSFDDVSVYVLNETTLKYEEKEMYYIKGFSGTDPYDIYLHGAKPAIILENNNATTDKELIIFRDSFTSSLAPLLINSYKKITLIDLRYIATPLLNENIVEFKDGQDVLIINCIDVLNNSSILKVL